MVSYTDLQSAIHEFLSRAGATAEQAIAITAEVLYAEITGRSTHGFDMLEAMKKRVNRTAGIPLEESEISEAAWVIVADGHAGPWVAARAVERARVAADRFGIGIAAAQSASTFLTAGYHPYSLAMSGRYVTIASSVAKARVAPYGGRSPILGTNPLGIGLPSTHGPMVIDIAMTPIAAAEVRRLARAGGTLPDGIAFDRDGNPTRSATDAVDGAMVPFGGYKGGALAIIVEGMVGGLLGVKCGLGHGDLRGMLFVVIKADLWQAQDAVAQWVGDLIDDVTMSPAIDDSRPPRTPGLTSHRAMDRAAVEGIELSRDRVEILEQLGIRVSGSRERT